MISENKIQIFIYELKKGLFIKLGKLIGNLLTDRQHTE